MKTLVVGDVHGCIEELEELLRVADYRQGDELWSIGDLVDKGPASADVVEMWRRLNGKMVRGNHEDKHIRYRNHVRKNAQNPAYKIPMSPPEDFIRTNHGLSGDDIAWLGAATTKAWLFDGAVMLVHAGPMKGKELYIRFVDKVTGNFIPFDGDYGTPTGAVHWSENWREPTFVVYGHQPWREVRQVSTTFGSDTGCVHGGKLTALVWDEDSRPYAPRIVQVNARAAYDPRELAE